MLYYYYKILSYVFNIIIGNQMIIVLDTHTKVRIKACLLNFSPL